MSPHVDPLYERDLENLEAFIQEQDNKAHKEYKDIIKVLTPVIGANIKIDDLKSVFKKSSHLFDQSTLITSLLSQFNKGLPLFNERFVIYNNSFNNSMITLEITSLDYPITHLEVKLHESPPKKPFI